MSTDLELKKAEALGAAYDIRRKYVDSSKLSEELSKRLNNTELGYVEARVAKLRIESEYGSVLQEAMRNSGKQDDVSKVLLEINEAVAEVCKPSHERRVKKFPESPFKDMKRTQVNIDDGFLR